MDDLTKRQLIAALRAWVDRYAGLTVEELALRNARGQLPLPALVIIEHRELLAQLEAQ